MRDVMKKLPPRLELALLPTPVRFLRHLSETLGNGAEIYLKRDDLTGCALSGNKARKLEFLLADAQSKKSTILLTCGGVQSNHARSTAIAGRQLGMKSFLLLRGEKPQLPEANLTLDLLAEAQVRYVNKAQYLRADELLAEEAEKLRSAGEAPYIIPEGGSNALGSLGYATAVREIKKQASKRAVDYIVTAVGSGGTFAGLVMGTQMFGLPARVIGFNICAGAEFFAERARGIIREAREKFGLPLREEGDWEIIDGYAGEGYAVPYPEQVATLRFLAREEGVLLDPVYTGKAFHGLLQEIKKGRFGHKKRFLFIHSGGLFGLLTRDFAQTLISSSA